MEGIFLLDILDIFAKGDYFVDMRMNLIISEPQLLGKTLGI